MLVALIGLPIGYSVIVTLTGLPIGYNVIVALTGILTHKYACIHTNCMHAYLRAYSCMHTH